MPSHVSKDGLMDGTAWRATVGGDVVRTVMEDGAVVDVENEDTYRHTGNPFGLQLVINCDWFAVKGLKDSSVGVIYAAIANLPRDMCFRSRYTCLLTVIPGPREPAEDCLSKVLAPIIADMKYCEGGFNMMLNEYPFPSPPRLHRVATRVLLNTSDLPATRKLSGFVGLANKTHPCHHCKIKRDDVNSPRGYDWRRLPLRDPEQMLAAAFRYRDTDDPGERAQIEEQYGVRFSPFLELVGYQHSASNPVDPLHNSFLGMAKSLVNMVLGIDRLFDGELAGEDRMERFTAVFERASVPGHLGRIAQRIALQFTSRKKKAGSGLKADQWKRVVQMLPVALYASWRSEDSDAICPTEIDRVRWYSAILSFCAGIRILHAHSITQNDADDGVQYLADAACSILSLDGHLTPNWHIAMHYSHFVMLYGPLQGYGTWPFERNNGKLSRIKHNLKPHETPSTVLRAWLLESHIAKVLSNPAPDADPRELAALERMREDRQKTRGTVMLDEVRGNKANRTMRLPAPYRPKQMVSLRRLSAYEPLLRYLTINYPQCNLVDVAHLQGENPCLPDRSHECYTLYTHVVFNGFK
ncbi:hypothetical protein FFLO_01053 [Filobasidium floriforme]|uniref:Uncharacterized protein n=1 Tax=Filobasidium floriforme TaxID=5210 RepID=A0A8K0JQZ9_9TREE|nr:hypothetical protein FFLO_01053 [Filobasidium floriforme]